MHVSKREDNLRQLIDEYGGCVLGTAMRILKNKQDAEDVFQNTFVKAYTKSLPFKSREHIKPWLLRVTHNECISYLRSGWKSKVYLSKVPSGLCDGGFVESEVLGAVNSLSDTYRRAVYLHYFCGFTSSEIAQLEGVSSSAIRTRLERARTKLKYELEGIL